MSTKPIPDGYPVLCPYLVVAGAAQAIEFYKDVFGATERMRLDAPGDKVGHSELLIGGCLIMLADEFPEMGAIGPKTVGGSPVMLHLYVEEVDTVFARALAAGATVKEAVHNTFYGDRAGGLIDPFGHLWYVATRVEDVSPEETQRRAAMKPEGS
jgi:PhnB protein